MGVVALKSTAITNADSTPRIVNSAYIDGAMRRSSVGKVPIITTDSVGSTYRVARLPSNARITAIAKTCGAGGATGTADLGLYKTAADGGAVVSAALFATATDLKAAVSETPVAVALAGNKEKRLWELVGLTADPKIDYDVALTLAQVVAANIDAAIEIDWVE